MRKFCSVKILSTGRFAFTLVFILFLILFLRGRRGPDFKGLVADLKTTDSGLKDDRFRVERRQIPGIIHRQDDKLKFCRPSFWNDISVLLSFQFGTTTSFICRYNDKFRVRKFTMSNHLVTKSNHLIEAGYKLSFNEQRLILIAITHIDARKPLPLGNDFTITAAEFSEIFGIPIKQSYEVLEDASTRLYDRDIKTYDKLANTRERFRWVDGVKYWDKEGRVTLSFSRHISPYLTLLHQKFTSYEIKQISKLKTAYAIRFYELLIQFIQTGERYISLEKLRELLEINNEYPRFFDLKKRIIIPSIRDIVNSTNLLVEWDTHKEGRFIKGLIFIFQ